MQRRGADIRLSASDLMRFTECRHATWRELEHLSGRGPKPVPPSADAGFHAKRGRAHEAQYLAALRAAGRQVVQIRASSWHIALKETEAALQGGAEVVAQAALGGGLWGGYADFLERVEADSVLGPFSYEVVDTKLKCTPAPGHVLQLALYSDLLAALQGRMPERAHIQLGTGVRHTLDLAEYAAYVRVARRRMEDFVAAPAEVRPVPCAACDVCRWRENCDARWDREDSLFRLAGVRQSQVWKLEAAGIRSIAGLAAHEEAVPKMAVETLQKLHAQARLQHARKTGDPAYEVRASMPGKGFELLPRPDGGDLFYDIEGYPYYHERGVDGLEYLHGVWDGRNFKAFWAHDRDAERAELERLFAYFSRRMTEHPHAHIYHYAPYEITALRRLATRHGHGEGQLDRWLRERRFVDLYAVVRGGVIASEPSYSLKDMEAFYDLERTSEVKTAGGSILAYEQYRETGDEDILSEIEQYNEVDCISAERLRDWLLGIRPEGPWPEGGQAETEKSEQVLAAFADMHRMLSASGLEERRRKLLFDLGVFHWREAKPAAWAVFDASGKESEELQEDLNCLAGLQKIGNAEAVKRSVQVDYAFPAQGTKLRAGSRAIVATEERFTGVTVVNLNQKKRRVTLKVGLQKADALRPCLDLLPDFAVKTDVIQQSIRRVIADQCGERRFSAADDLLALRAPRFRSEAVLPVRGDLLNGLKKAVQAMDATVLPVQGPPGTGKTYVAARAILALVRGGHRIAVSSNSHAAIAHVLEACAEAGGEDLLIAHKVGTSAAPPRHPAINLVSKNSDSRLATASIVGGTAWLFAREEQEGAFDYLFVDEAGQVSLANLVGMAPCARNIVLVGDPRQLPQVIQGAHPPGADLSCLDWLLGAGRNVESDRGMLLDITYRMHPDLCAFISGQFYGGLVKHDPSTERQVICAAELPRAGAFWMSVAHEGRTQHAPEEIEAIRAMIDRLVAGTWTDRSGRTRQLRPSDIIVVAPYNVQVLALSESLPDIRVGTVDRFQGQEAPVALVSMTDSSVSESSRGLDFLLSRERLNVAISRGKALSMVFASPTLLHTPCSSVAQMRLVNALCALPEYGV